MVTTAVSDPEPDNAEMAALLFADVTVWPAADVHRLMVMANHGVTADRIVAALGFEGIF